MYKFAARPIIYDRSQPQIVWRFYSEPHNEWKWQRLSVVGDVITESTRGYISYDECVADAKRSGYVSEPAQTRKPFDNSRHVKPTGLM